jgi:hypothetical protein
MMSSCCLPRSVSRSECAWGRGRSRLERRQIRTSVDLAGYSDFPGLRQVAQIRTTVLSLKTGEVREDSHYVPSSLYAEDASPARLFWLMHVHWGLRTSSFMSRTRGWRGSPCVELASERGGDEPVSLSGAQSAGGQNRQWEPEEPLTSRGHAVSAQPLAIRGSSQ